MRFIEKKYLENIKKLDTKNEKIAVAVSGGIDSMVLAHLSAQLLKTENHYLIIDHALRKNSKTEAEKTFKQLSTLSKHVKILTWQHTGITNNIQARAREARYSLLSKYCTQNEIDILLTGHQLNDQVETFLMRITRSSGLKGLVSIAEISLINGIKVGRPLINIPREVILEYAKQQKIVWIEDPSNRNKKYSRTNIREIIEHFNIQDMERISKSIEQLSHVNQFIDEQVRELLLLHLKKIDSTSISFPHNIFQKSPQELAWRILYHIFHYHFKKEPRGGKLFLLQEHLIQNNFSPKELGGIRIILKKKEILFSQL